MKRTPLLEKILAFASKTSQDYGEKEITKDCFLYATLRSLPEVEEASDEELDIYQFLSQYSNLKGQTLFANVCEISFHLQMDSSDYLPWSIVEEMAKKEGKEELNTLDVLKYLFTNPSELMKRNFTFTQENDNKQNNNQENEQDDKQRKRREKNEELLRIFKVVQEEEEPKVSLESFKKAIEKIEGFMGKHPDFSHESHEKLVQIDRNLRFALRRLEEGREEKIPPLLMEYLDEDYISSLFSQIIEDEKEKAVEEIYKKSHTKLDDSSEDKEKAEETKEEEKTTANEEFFQLILNTKKICQELRNKVFGQDHVIDAFITGIFKAEVEAKVKRKRSQPMGSFLFVGPPGVGKTYLVQQASELLKLPYRRFDMSEYADKDAHLTFAGFDSTWKNAHEGIVTGFVKENPHSLLLFDEIEKANVNVKNLFLQILDAGRLKDSYHNEEISFKDCIIVFTTNAGRDLYEDSTIPNLSTLSRKVILNALQKDVDPITNIPSFPKAICSRFSSGNVLMFQHLPAHHLIRIIDKSLKESVRDFQDQTTFQIHYDNLLPYLILFSEGGKADARMIKGRSKNFVYEEIYELFNLLNSSKTHLNLEKLKEISFTVELPTDEKTRSLFEVANDEKLLVFADESTIKKCKKAIKSIPICYASNMEKAKEIIYEENVSMILMDIRCGIRTRKEVLNIEDIDSEGRDFFLYACSHFHIPLFILEKKDGEISVEEQLSLIRGGAYQILSLSNPKFDAMILEQKKFLYHQKSLQKLAKSHQVLTYKTAQNISKNKEKANIVLFDLQLQTAVDAKDNESMVSDISKENIRFDDIIGAHDAKEELKYFIQYLKNPMKYIRSGLSAPKGLLLYGPPGTGKTLLAKALASESDVTFLHAEGNQFLKPLVGTGSQSVHDLFKLARKYAPSILFVDEIDAIAKERGLNLNENTGDVLTSFLTEMDGFVSNSDRPVFVLAATNYSIRPGEAKSLDAALLRRFDRKILVDLPNKEERKQFIHQKMNKSKHIHLSEEEIENIAIRSTGMSLSNLDSIFEFALRNAFRTQEQIVNGNILDDAFETSQSGEEKKWDPKELERTARHEAGHAFVCYLQGETPSYLTIVARDNHGGYMLHADQEQKGIYTKEELLQRVRVSLAGRAAEVVYYGKEQGLSTGAQNDLEKAARTITHMLCSYGMDEEIGLLPIDTTNLELSPIYEEIRKRMRVIIQEEFAKTVEMIQQNKDSIDCLVQALLEKNKLTSNEIDRLLTNVRKGEHYVRK